MKFDLLTFILTCGAFWSLDTPWGTLKRSKRLYLQYGSRGVAVRLAQEWLINLGYQLPTYGADGIFGMETWDAVTRFQQDHDLTPDGIIGNDTLNKIKRLQMTQENT